MTDLSPIIGIPPTGLYKRDRRPMALFDRSLIVPAIWDSFRKLDPRTLVKNPVMFCVEIVSVLTTVFFLRDLFVGGGKVVGSSALFSGQITVWLWFTVLFANFAEAVAEGRGKAQADTLRRTRTETKAKRIEAAQSRAFRSGRRRGAEARRSGAGRDRRSDPERRRSHRGRRLGRRVGDHRRIGAGHPRERRRPLGGHRRHPGHLGLAQGADHRGAGLDLSRPHDRAGRRGGAAEDAERDRAQHPARRHDPDLRLRHRDDPELCGLCRGRGVGRRADRAVRLPDPDDDRRAAVGDRHRRHGPAGALQRAGDVGPRGRGRGRCRHPAARQDRHDHPRQPPGDRVHRAARGRRSRAGRCGAVRLAVGRDPGGPLDRRAGQGEIRPARARNGAARRPVRAVLGADPDERHRCRRRLDPQGRGRRDHRVCRRRQLRTGMAQCRRGRAGGTARGAGLRCGAPDHPDRRAHLQGGRHARSPSPRTSGCLASFTSRTSSRAASASALPNCAGWASAR